jgi:hypothetical protein
MEWSSGVLTDNGSCYRSHLWGDTCQQLAITHKRTRPYWPQTNGKVCEYLGGAAPAGLTLANA